MRKVPRRHTARKDQPWKTVPLLVKLAKPHGTFLATNHQDWLHVKRGGVMFKAGILAYGLRLYQHRGKSLSSTTYDADGVTCVAYDLVQEWPRIVDPSKPLDWIEFMDLGQKAAYRITRHDACRYGFRFETPLGSRWLVPLNRYERTTSKEH